MWNEPSKEDLGKIPELYDNVANEVKLKDVIIHEHFFIGGSDWYIAEFDGDDIMWGFCVLNGDLDMAEWGYISLSELKSIQVKQKINIGKKSISAPIEVERDLYWVKKKFSECNIK